MSIVQRLTTDVADKNGEQRDTASDAITIHFRRDPRSTMGAKNRAWSEVDGHRYESNGGAMIYKLLTKLNAEGYAGRRFVADDGRMVCLQGMVRDCTFDIKKGRAPSRKRYEANIGPWPVVIEVVSSDAFGRTDASPPSGTPPPRAP